jgi:hypothetical protein
MLTGRTDYYVILNPIRGNRISCPDIVREALSAMASAIEQPVWQCQRDYSFRRVRMSQETQLISP